MKKRRQLTTPDPHIDVVQFVFASPSVCESHLVVLCVAQTGGMVPRTTIHDDFVVCDVCVYCVLELLISLRDREVMLPYGCVKVNLYPLYGPSYRCSVSSLAISTIRHACIQGVHGILIENSVPQSSKVGPPSQHSCNNIFACNTHTHEHMMPNCNLRAARRFGRRPRPSAI